MNQHRTAPVQDPVQAKYHAVGQTQPNSFTVRKTLLLGLQGFFVCLFCFSKKYVSYIRGQSFKKTNHKQMPHSA